MVLPGGPRRLGHDLRGLIGQTELKRHDRDALAQPNSVSVRLRATPGSRPRLVQIDGAVRRFTGSDRRAERSAGGALPDMTEPVWWAVGEFRDTILARGDIQLRP